MWGPDRGPHVSGIESRACDSDSQATLEYLLDNIWIVGSPETVAKKVAALGDAVGGLGPPLVIAHEWQPRAAWGHSMTLLSTEVLPRLEARR